MLRASDSLGIIGSVLVLIGLLQSLAMVGDGQYENYATGG